MLTPELVLHGYLSGVFPMADSRDGAIAWYEPRERGILEFSQLRISRSLRKVLKSGRFSVTYNRAFESVISACAQRDVTWISREIETTFLQLHHLGFAHSLEVWYDAELAGGLYGVALGGVFFGESMFHRVTDASKVALVHLVRHLEERGFQLLDMQFLTSHLQSLGGSEICQSEFLRRLAVALHLPAVFHEPDKPTGELRVVV